MSRWKYIVVALGVGALTLAAEPSPAQQVHPPIGAEEWPPVVKRLEGKESPPGFALATPVVHMVKRAEARPTSAKRYFAGRGLTVTDEDLQYLLSLYGSFDEDHNARHDQVLREHSGDSARIEASVQRFQLERASLTGAVLGAFLARLEARGQNTERFLVEVLERDLGTAFWGGEAPTWESLERRSSLFEESFQREYGRSLAGVLASEKGEGK